MRLLKCYLVFLCIIQAVYANEKPNIVLILADDLGYGDVSAYNPESKVKTVHMDRIAKEGMRFTRAYSAAAVCVPSRYGLLTGQHPSRAEPLRWRSHPTIKEGRMTIASLLKSEGYNTACIGKWHGGFVNGTNKPEQNLKGGPLDRGFDYFFGQHGSLDQPPYFYIRNRKAVVVPRIDDPGSKEKGLSLIYQGKFWRPGKRAKNFKHEEALDVYKQEALDFLLKQSKNENKKPFFLYFPLTSPHGPWIASKTFQGKSKIGPLGDFLLHTDDVVGQILTQLDQLKLSKNTLVILTSDNGPLWMDKDAEKTGHASSGPFRGRKSDIWDGGIHMPFMVRWPGVVPKNTESQELICQTDFLATFAAIVKKDLSKNAGEDSYNMLPAFKVEKLNKPIRDGMLIQSVSKKTMGVIEGDWKLIPWLGNGGFLSKGPRVRKSRKGEARGQLYNLINDPGEKNNVYSQYPEVVQRLNKLLNQYINSGQSNKN